MKRKNRRKNKTEKKRNEREPLARMSINHKTETVTTEQQNDLLIRSLNWKLSLTTKLMQTSKTKRQ